MSDETLGRRNFIGGGLGVAAGVSAGCARGARPAGIDPADVALWVGRLERSAQAIDQSPLLAELVPPPGPEATSGALADWDATDQQLRGCVRSLYMGGAFLDLPREAQDHPEVQARMFEELPAIEAHGEMLLRRLERSSLEERQQLRRTLQEDPDTVRRLAQVLDERAELGGLRPQRRRQMRDIFRLAGWRMRAQPPSIIIDEYVSKARRVQAWRGVAGPQEEESGSVLGPVPPPPADDGLPEDSGGMMPPLPPSGLSPAAYDPGEAVRTQRELAEQIEAIRQGGARRVRAGGWMLGLGLVFGPTGGLLIATADDLNPAFWVGNVMVTHGVVLFALGIVFLLVGSSRRRRADRMAAEAGW